MEKRRWYYYLHSNGSLIGKNPLVVDGDPSYFDSPFVEKFWEIDTADRGDLWKVLLEALALGARIERIKELAGEWGATLADSVEMLKRVKPSELMRKGLEIFIDKILSMDEETYWKEVKANWGEGNEA
jgi:hypothetical protein